MPLRESAVLLGAGASVEAGVPTSFGMTQRIVDKIGRTRRYSYHAAALNFVCGALIAYKAAAGASPFGGLDIEEVFAAVELLAERHSLEVTPFVASWHAAVDTWDQRPSTAPSFFDKKLRDAVLHGGGGQGIQRLIGELIDSRTGSATTGATYRELATQMLTALRDLVSTTPKKLDYLRPLAVAGAQPGGLSIATLNYDVSVEQAAILTSTPLTTGIENWITSGTWDWRDHGIRLLKLHGSIEWVWRLEHHDRSVPHEVVAVEPGSTEPPAVIFGQRAKLRAEGPFLGLLAEFERQLAQARRLVVIGYSFRDDHVNEIIRRWIADDDDRKLLIVDPNWPEALRFPSQDFRSILRHSLMPPRRAPDAFEPRLEVSRKRCSEALRDLLPVA